MIEKDERKIKKNFGKLASIFLIYEIGLLYVKFFLSQDFIEEIAYNQNYTMESLDLLISGGIILVLSLILIVCLKLLNKNPNLKYDALKLTAIDFITLLLMVIASSLFMNYLMSEMFNYVGDSKTLLLPIGILARFDTSSPIYIIYVLLLFPIMEIIIYFNLLINYLKRYGFRFAIMVSALIFALAHNDFSYFFPAFILGYLLATITVRYNSYLPALLIYILNNCFFYLPYVIDSSLYWLLVISVFIIFMLGAYFVFIRGKFQMQFSYKFYNRAIYLFYTNPLVVLMIVIFIAGNLLEKFL